MADTPTDGNVECGQVWRGVGQPMIVKAVEGDLALLGYLNGNDEEWWECVGDIAEFFDLVTQAPHMGR